MHSNGKSITLRAGHRKLRKSLIVSVDLCLFFSFAAMEGNIFTHKCPQHSSSGINKKYDNYVESAKKQRKLYEEEEEDDEGEVD